MRIPSKATALLLLALCAGCGDTTSPPAVGGVVEAPGGEIAATARPTAFAVLADLVCSNAWALTGLDPVGRGVDVKFQRIDGEGRVTETLITEPTFSDGTYTIYLASDELPSSFLTLSVGAANSQTLMRAFLYALTVDINPASEATVRLVLGSDFPLANFSASDLQNIQAQVDRATADVPAGDSIAEANEAAEDAAAFDQGVIDAIDQAGES